MWQRAHDLHFFSQSITRRSFVAGLGLGAAGRVLSAAPPARWAVVYAGDLDPFALADYDLVVLDADHHPPLSPITERGRTALAYLSLTQVGRHRPFFDTLVRAGLVRAAHPVWSDSNYLDFRRPEWTKLVIEDLIPGIAGRGFGGLFLDTLDDAEYLERTDRAAYAGSRLAALRLVRSIRQQYPALTLMMNRGFGLVPDLSDSIDILLGESVLTTFAPSKKSYTRVSQSDAEWQVNALIDARRRNSRLTLCTLDYWDSTDREGVRRIYEQQRARGFVPYVSTPLLDRLIPEPR